MVFFSGLFFLFLQVPYSFKYALMIRQDLNANRHLIRRIIWINAFNIPLWIQGNVRANKLTTQYSEKYLADLSDHELSNFDTIYKGLK